MEKRLHRIEQRAIPVLCEEAPSPFNGIVLTMIWRGVGQLDSDLEDVPTAIAAEVESDKPRTFRDGAKIFFNKGTNARWQAVLTEAELATYEETKASVLIPDCARWLELGRAGLELASPQPGLASYR